MSQPPYGQNPGGQNPGGQNPGGQPSYGQNPPSGQSYGQGAGQSYGQGTAGQSYGQGTAGQSTPGQAPYGQASYNQTPQQPYAQGTPTGPSHPTTPPAKKGPNIGLLVGAGVLALALVAGLIWAFTRKDPTTQTTVAASTPVAPTSASGSAKPSTSTSASKATASASGSGEGFTASGSTLTGKNFTTTLPSGWSLSDKNGSASSKNQGQIIDKNKNVISYYEKVGNQPTGAEAKCKTLIEGIRVTPDDKVTPAPALTMGGQPAYGAEITVKRAEETRQEVFGYYCTDRPEGTSVVESIAWIDDEASVRTATQKVLSAWKWK